MTVDIEKLKALAQSVPEHIQLKGWFVGNPAFGNQYVYADNFKGQGRQHIATLPAHKAYFGSMADFIAAANPAAVLELIAEVERLRAAPAAGAVESDELAEAAEAMLDVLDGYEDQLVPINRKSATVERLRAAIEASAKAGKEQ